MTQSRKYAALPDLDSAPDVYETPDLTDDTSTLPTSGTVRSGSPSSNKDFDDESTNPNISSQRLHPQQARSHFSTAKVDARDADFSDRLNAKRKSYRVSRRRLGQGELEPEELGDSSEDENESLGRKLARLRREAEEVREELRMKEAEAGDLAEVEADPTIDEAFRKQQADTADICDMLDHLRVVARGPSAAGGAEAQLVRKINTSLVAAGPRHTTISQTDNDEGQGISTLPSYTINYAPDFEQTHTLAKVADFDSRLLLLEKVLGLPSPLSMDFNPPTPILQNLGTLQDQLKTLVDASPASLDALSRRVRQLTHETEKFDEARRQLKAGAKQVETSRPGHDDDEDEGAAGDTSADGGIDEERAAKVTALYGTLPTIENLAPLLPPLLDRLRSLRDIHAGAADASDTLAEVEKRQEEMEKEIQGWRESLEQTEASMRRNEETLKGNVQVVEGWVRDLEARLAKAGG
ncbi:MAG: hypothetical protein M1825_002919 [Sarcosagium campestre]|nr:MAG: hypothetical protein M1825_002919 [Sarcosagium campestre]